MREFHLKALMVGKRAYHPNGLEMRRVGARSRIGEEPEDGVVGGNPVEALSVSGGVDEESGLIRHPLSHERVEDIVVTEHGVPCLVAVDLVVCWHEGMVG